MTLHDNRVVKRVSSKRKSVAQKRHQEKAKQAMLLFKTGKTKTLKAAWKLVNQK